MEKKQDKKKQIKKIKFYSLTKILSYDCIYNMIYGERSNGKTFAVHEYIIKRFWETGECGAIIRRWEIDFQGKNGQATFDGVVNADIIKKTTNGKWDGIRYYAGRWYFAKYDDKLDKVVTMEKPFCYAFALTMGEHYKSTSYTSVTTILFDEFLTRKSYVPDEFILFQNIISTIVRQRDNVKIFMLGNTVNNYSPYFEEMGIREHIKKMKQGDIEIVNYGESGLTLAIEYCGSNKEGKLSDKYFAFNNPKLKMITSGSWEMNIYPHLPYKYINDDVKFSYFVMFNGETLHCEIIEKKKGEVFTYIHRKTTPIKEDKDIVFSPEYSPSVYRARRITKPYLKIHKYILDFFKQEKVFYQSNEVGEIMRNYLDWCDNENLYR